VHVGLKETWHQMVTSKPEELKELAAALAINVRDDPLWGGYGWLGNLSLNQYASAWEIGMRIKFGGKTADGTGMSNAELDVVELLKVEESVDKCPVAGEVYGLLAAGHRLRDLDVGTGLSSPQVLEGITEYLGVRSRSDVLLEAGSLAYWDEREDQEKPEHNGFDPD